MISNNCVLCRMISYILYRLYYRTVIFIIIHYFSGTLKELSLKKNEISAILQSRMELLSLLEILDLTSNNLVILPSFNNMTNLLELYCNTNDIAYFDANHFSGTVLVTLKMSDNPLTITNIIIPTSLEKLLMEETDVQNLTIQCTSPGLCALKVLLLKSDMLESPIIDDVKPTLKIYTLQGVSVGIPADGLRSDAFTDIPNLVTLELSKHSFDPQIAYMQPITVKSLYLKHFNISDDNALFGSEVLGTQTDIDQLYLGHNVLTRIPDVSSLPLTLLKLQENHITFIDSNILARMTLLQTINFEENPIVNIGHFPYEVLPNIIHINIR